MGGLDRASSDPDSLPCGSYYVMMPFKPDGKNPP